MTFYLVAKAGDSVVQPTLLLQAAAARSIAAVLVPVGTADVCNLPTLQPGDMLYRDAAGERAINIERQLIRQDTATFYVHTDMAFAYRASSFFANNRDGLPVIPTYSGIPVTDIELHQVVDNLGGFPLVVKVRGGSKGVGVIRADSLESLRSVLDYLREQQVTVFIRKYIDHAFYGRLVVVGDRVVASNRTHVPLAEFRSNTVLNHDDNREPIVFDESVQALAVAATQSCGLAFGGVDVLFDRAGQVYVAEVNFPCQFSTAEQLTGIDVAGAMVDFLYQKCLVLKASAA